MYNDFPVLFDEHGLKFLYTVLIIIGLLLQSCQNSLKIEKDKRAAQYNRQLGLAYLSQGNMELAKNKLLRALSQNKTSASVNSAVAYFMDKVGEQKMAEYYYQRAIRLAPRSGAELNNYGAYLCRHGNYQKANQYFMLALNDVNYEHIAAVYENAGLCNMAMPNNQRAVYYFKKALLQDPARKRSLQEIVYYEIKHNHTLAACKYLRKYRAVVREDGNLSKIEMKFCRYLRK